MNNINLKIQKWILLIIIFKKLMKQNLKKNQNNNINYHNKMNKLCNNQFNKINKHFINLHFIQILMIN